MKKIWLFFLSIIAILWIWMSFADVVMPNTHYVDRCVKVTNPHWIPWYKLVVRRDEFDFGKTHYSVYSVEEGECLSQFSQWWSSRSSDFPYLVDENIDISTLDNLPSEEFENKIWKHYKFNQIYPNGWYVSDSNPIKNEIITYKIVENWNYFKLEKTSSEEWMIDNNEKWDNTIEDEDDYTLEIVETEQGIELVSTDRLTKFWIAWILTILIETIVLFAIAKLFRKENQISNWRLLLTWILASTITLPLLRFVLPLFVTNEIIYMTVWELAVTLIEIFIIKYWLKISRGKAILVSVLCNLCSFLFWLLVL